MNLDPRYHFAETLPLLHPFPLPKLDIESFRESLAGFLRETPFTDQNQIGLTTVSKEDQNPYGAVGSLYSKADDRWITKESQYKFFIEKFEKTFLHEIYQSIVEKSPLPIGRVRLMRLRAKSCYSVHRDNSIRYHLAVDTNPHSYIAFKDRGLIHIPSDGQFYATNTLLEHTALNGGETDRIHFVFSTAWVPDAEERLKRFYGTHETL